jgi:hypothetical protein
MFWIQLSNKEEQRNSYKWENQFLHLKSLKTLKIPILVLTVLASFITIILLASTEESYAQESDKNIKLAEYTNSKGDYKISYPSYARVMEQDEYGIEKSRTMIVSPEWEFTIIVYRAAKNVNLDWEMNSFMKFVKSQGVDLNEKKSLTVAGKPASMVIGEWRSIMESDTFMLNDDIVYHFVVVAPQDKFNQYGDIFFKMLKSFELKD